ncbi:unnamed protein product [Paramecium octaurelia]|uniref:Uncharacterized protein n=1 Tax=Paramecium octaurelia TaxID=43137 RepID=A0A8S1Y0L4_PAROT|nr:unnamed protein product [Paramecium octaurelia]
MKMNTIMRHEKGMAEACTVYYAMFAHKSDLIKRRVQPFQIYGFYEIESFITHMRRKTYRGVEYTMEDTKK